MDPHRDVARLLPDQRDARQARLLALLLPIHDRARRTARRLCTCAADGDDLFQEAVLRAFFHLPSLREESRFAGWFYAVLLSVHRARSRVSFWRRFLPLDGAPPGAADAGSQPAWSPMVAEQTRGRAARLAQALRRLPAEQREAVVLFEVEEFSILEIAEMQGVSQTAVKTRLRRGRQRLRHHYEQLGEELGEQLAERLAEQPEEQVGERLGRREGGAESAASAPPTARPVKEVCHG